VGLQLAIFRRNKNCANPSQLALAGVRQAGRSALAFRFSFLLGFWAGLASENFKMAFAAGTVMSFSGFGRFGVGGALGWGFAGAIDRIGGQLVGLAVSLRRT